MQDLALILIILLLMKLHPEGKMGDQCRIAYCWVVNSTAPLPFDRYLPWAGQLCTHVTRKTVREEPKVCQLFLFNGKVKHPFLPKLSNYIVLLKIACGNNPLQSPCPKTHSFQPIVWHKFHWTCFPKFMTDVDFRVSTFCNKIQWLPPTIHWWKKNNGLNEKHRRA